MKRSKLEEAYCANCTNKWSVNPDMIYDLVCPMCGENLGKAKEYFAD